MSAYKSILRIVFKQLSKKLNVKEDFIVNIYEEENSWNFISKLAQLVEGVFTKILVQRLNEPGIFGAISNLPQATRIALSHDLRIINKEQKFLFLTIAEMRNDYIHNISNIDVSLGDYLSGLSESRKKEIFKRFKPFINDEVMGLDSFVEDCQNIIFVASSQEVLRINGEIESREAERNHKNFRARQAERLLPKRMEGSMYLDDKIMVGDYVDSARVILRKGGLL